MNLKPWREIAVPHEDVLKGTFSQAEFAADITRVHQRTAASEYSDPVLFFRRTFITEGMSLLLTSVAKRLAGLGGDPVIQLQTAFGGGKTHTMLAVMHMVRGEAPRSDMEGVPQLLNAAGILDLPAAKLAVLDGINLSPSQPRVEGGQALRTLWGDLAWQLGKAEGYALVADADASGTSPGKEVLIELLSRYAPCVVLMDELVAYIRQFEEGRSLSGGSFDSNLSFLQALTEAIKAVPTGVLLASLPESHVEAGSQRGVRALESLEQYFGRVQAIWKPVSTEESFEIVRRRLFAEIRDRDAADAVCRAFADTYAQHGSDLPSDTQTANYALRMRAAYPIHVEVFERLYEDWSTLPNFQRTRGVLKLMAKVIHRLWQDNNRDLLLMPGSLPLYNREVHGELTTYLQTGWDPVIEKDVDGERSEPADIEQREVRFGAVQACRRVARTIFLGSAPGSANVGARGIETERVLLGCLQPGQAPHIFRDALTRLESRLSYLNKANNRWWLDVQPNLRREMEDRKRRIPETEVTDLIASELGKLLRGGKIDNIHCFTPSADVPDDWALRLVVLPPSAAWSRTGPNPARDAAAAILRSRGEQPRVKQNRLLFLAVDSDQVAHLKDTVRGLQAWRSIEFDVRELRLTLDNQRAKQVSQLREQAAATVARLVRESYRWLLAPSQTASPDGKVSELSWDAHTLGTANVQGMGKELDRVLLENELVIYEWAPVHLHGQLKRWFWKPGAPEVPALEFWHKSCQYLYFPRLEKSTVLQATIAAGAASRDFFGLASEKSEAGNYRGFTLGKMTTPFIEATLLIDPDFAAYFEAQSNLMHMSASGLSQQPSSLSPTIDSAKRDTSRENNTSRQAEPKTRYFATVQLDAVKGTLEFSRVMQEVVELFSSSLGTKVRLRLDIEAENPKGFDETTQRAARENSRALRFEQADFD